VPPAIEGDVRLCQPTGSGASGSGSSGSIRLVGYGASSYAGRVEVLHDGVWGTVCDDDWDSDDARVVCRQLGFLGGVATSNANSGAGSGPVWLDDVGCSGGEAELSDCSHRGWGTENCGHIEDAGVTCDAPAGSSSSPSSSQPSEPDHDCGASNTWGYVEIYHDGLWGAVCDENGDGGWSHYYEAAEYTTLYADLAAVVCAQLGMSEGAPYSYFTPGVRDPSSGVREAASSDPASRIWMTRPPECDGNEPKLAECERGRDFRSESESWAICRAPQPHLRTPALLCTAPSSPGPALQPPV